jgi:hypothetical protein
MGLSDISHSKTLPCGATEFSEGWERSSGEAYLFNSASNFSFSFT